MNTNDIIFSLKNKTAVVTGALGLLGKQHCYALSEAGANVIVCDLDEMRTVQFSMMLPTKSHGHFLDVTDSSSIHKLRNFILDTYGSLDILVNNAAINDMFEDQQNPSEASKFENYPLELWNRSLGVNITGVFLCSQILGSIMAQKGKGSIINIASTYGMVAPDQAIYQKPDGSQSFYKSPVYSATKGAVLSFTRFLASYWGKKGVRVNSLSPGGVENDQENFFKQNYSERTPLGRMSDSTDYKGAIVFLASDASSYMTGSNLIIDGGWTAW